MSATFRRGKPISFGLKVGVSIIIICAIIGLATKYAKLNQRAELSTPSGYNQQQLVDIDLLLFSIALPMGADRSESAWSEALALYLNGDTEVAVDRGRVDVATPHYAIEVDYLNKWHEGLGQAIHYADELERVGVLALIVDDDALRFSDLEFDDIDLLVKIQKLSLQSGVLVIVLFRAESSG